MEGALSGQSRSPHFVFVFPRDVPEFRRRICLSSKRQALARELPERQQVLSKIVRNDEWFWDPLKTDFENSRIELRSKFYRRILRWL